MGASVADMASLGEGYPDCLVGMFGVTHCVEIKDGKKPPSKRKLTLEQETWRDNWRGDYSVVTTPQEAMALIVQWEQERNGW